MTPSKYYQIVNKSETPTKPQVHCEYCGKELEVGDNPDYVTPLEAYRFDPERATNFVAYSVKGEKVNDIKRTYACYGECYLKITKKSSVFSILENVQSSDIINILSGDKLIGTEIEILWKDPKHLNESDFTVWTVEYIYHHFYDGEYDHDLILSRNPGPYKEPEDG